MNYPEWLVAIAGGLVTLVLRELVIGFLKKKDKAEEKLKTADASKLDRVVSKLDEIGENIASINTEVTSLTEQNKTVFERLSKFDKEISELRSYYIDLLKKE